MSDKSNKNEISHKKLEAYLLYGQSVELIRLYNQELKMINVEKIKENNLVTEQYYLVDKKWLDNYKISLEFNLVKEDAEQYQYDSYEIFKTKITNRLKKNMQKKTLKIDPPKLEQELLADYEILIPKNFVLVRKEIFESSFLKSVLTYDVIICEKNIFIFDNKSEYSKTDNIFICSMKFNEDNDDIIDFVIDVDDILILNKQYAIEEKKYFFEMIKEGKGVKNYLKKRKLNDNKLGKQLIYGNNNINNGILFKVRNKNPEEEKISEMFLNEYIIKKYPEIKYKKGITKIILNSILNESKVAINRTSIQQNSKCITIYGNLYYYLNENDNNCFISQYQ